MKQQFMDKNFNASSLSRIALIDGILDEYAAMGYKLTLRQVYYQLVARGHSENTERAYKRAGALISDARLAGLIDWDMIEDRTRETIFAAHWADPSEIVDAAARQFRVDKWATQPVHVEMMVEKQALEGVLIPVCRDLDIRFSANRGYSSSSAMYEIRGRLLAFAGSKEIHFLYLGDHDPSGIDMTRDVQDRLNLFSGEDVHVHRLALNWEQIELWQPPENPAKTTDSRYAAYSQEFGENSWELDAVEPRTLASLVTDAVLNLRDDDLWNHAVDAEVKGRNELMQFVKDYNRRHST
jgi:hypothetical protein